MRCPVAEAVHNAPGSRAWSIRILARLVSDQQGGFVANPAGRVQRPCRFAIHAALAVHGVESLDDALRIPHVHRDVMALVNAYP